MPADYLVPFLVALVIILLTVWVYSAREKRKTRVYQKKFNPIVLDDKGRKRYFS
jgi:cbb3-type cytochrome oxidase subunit 3